MQARIGAAYVVLGMLAAVLEGTAGAGSSSLAERRPQALWVAERDGVLKIASEDGSSDESTEARGVRRLAFEVPEV